MASLNFFDDSEMSLLAEARRRVDAASATIVYCVYENPFACSGGLYAVAVNYAAALVAGGRETVVLSPFHSNVKTAAPEKLSRIGICKVPFGSENVSVQIYEHFAGNVRWVLFGAEGYFDASGGNSRSDPYVHDDPRKLLIDSLFASAAIPYVLAGLGMTSNLIVHVQDWELAATALTVKEALLGNHLQSAATVLTSHNPYDNELPATALSLLTSRPYRGDQPINTVYQCFSPLFDAPITTVSETFAEDLTSDPLQTEYFANHLQSIFADCGVIGVDNGPFLPSRAPFSEQAVTAAATGNIKLILSEKMQLRSKMLAELAEYNDPRKYGYLTGYIGGRLSELPDDIAVFFMFGRLDPGEKGFDVLARAIEAIPPGRCRFVITAIVPKPTPFSDDLRELAHRRLGDVVVYPFRMKRGYMETMAGATFAIMPSLYEPFGAATEPYLMGTPVISRATGGLCQQVVDTYTDAKRGTGLLYREVPPDQPPIGDQWQHIQQAATPQDRMSVPLYGAMVASLAATLATAAELHRSDKTTYAQMLANLAAKAESFSWERAKTEYQQVCETATKNLSENFLKRGGKAHFAPETPQNEPVPGGFRIGSK